MFKKIAKWLFEVRYILDKEQSQVRDLSQLLHLYYKAKELQIDFTQIEPQAIHLSRDEYILTDDGNENFGTQN